MAAKFPLIRKIRRRLSNLQVFLFPLLWPVTKIWHLLNRVFIRYDCRGPLFDYIAGDKRCIIALWHQDVLPLMFRLIDYTPRYASCFMVSPGRVGTIGGYLLGIYDIKHVSGTRHSGMAAIEELTRGCKEEGYSVLIMADGSRGPDRQARWGCLRLARNTGLPIIPVRAWSEHLAFLENTWMRLALPKPRGRTVILSGEPIYIGPEVEDGEMMEQKRQELEQSLNRLVKDAEDYFIKGPQSVAHYGEPAG